MGPKHKSKYKEGEVLNGFTLLRNIKRETSGGNLEWAWECKCDCGKIFYSREQKVETRIGCISCTAAKKQKEISLNKTGIEQQGLKGRSYREYIRGAKIRNIPFELTFDEFLELTQNPCYYCGEEPKQKESDVQYSQRFSEPWKHNGIDRKDTTKGYTIDNCVPCCSVCNYAKHDLTIDEFKIWIDKIHKHIHESKDFNNNEE